MGIENPETCLVNIYELRDPRDNKKCPRYVGITVQNIEDRLIGHLKVNSLIPPTYKNNWIKKLLREGITPTTHLIEQVIGWKYACEVEKYWVKEFKEQGYKLTNSTEGGEGTTGLKYSPEAVEKCRINNIGTKNPMYGKKGSLNPNYGKKQSKEIVEKRTSQNLIKWEEKGQIKDCGIIQNNRTGKWLAKICINGKHINLGTYSTKERALEIRTLAIKDKYSRKDNLTSDFIKEKYNNLSLCDNLLERKPTTSLKKNINKWVLRTSIHHKEIYFGVYNTEQGALNNWDKSIKQLIDKILANTKEINEL